MKKALALSLALCTSVFAANNLFEITPEVGGSFHIDSNTYGNQDLTYGLKFATRVAPTWLAEAGYNRISDADYKNNLGFTDVDRYFINLIKEFEIEDSKTTPYILGGIGYEYLNNNANSMDSAIFGQYGVGLRYAMAEYLHLKTELKHLASLDGRSDIVATIGFSIPFGTYAKEVEVVEEAVVIEEPKTHIHTFSVQFPTDSAIVAPQYNAEIKDFADSLKENPNQAAIIGGHTDSTGSDTYNQKLSQKRANAVKDAIIAEGVEAERLEAKGYGEARPIADNATKEGRAKNRRVEAEIFTK